MEGRERGFLRKVGGRYEQVLRQLVERRHVLLRRHHPAEAPAGHSEVFGKAVDDEHIVGELQGAAIALAVSQPVIDLVDDQHAAALKGDGMDAFELVVIDQRAGGVRRRSDQYGRGPFRPVFLDQRGGELVGR